MESATLLPRRDEPMTARRLTMVLVLAGMMAYLGVFYAAPLPVARTGPRAALFLYLLLPESLVEGWFGSPPEFVLWDRLPILALAGAIIAWAAALGWLAMRLLTLDRGLVRLERFVFSMAVGLNGVSTYVLLAGLLSRLDRFSAFVLPALATLTGVGWMAWKDRAARRSGILPLRQARLEAAPTRSTKGSKASVSSRPPARAQEQTEAGEGPISARWLWLLVPLSAVVVVGAMLPPIEFDVREYHLEAPKEFYQQGFIGFLPHNLYANMALGTEMFSLLGMVLAGDWWQGALAGKTVIALFAPLGALGLFAAGRRLFSPAAGTVAAVAYLSTGWILQISNYGMVEGAFALDLLLATYSLLLGARDWRRVALAGYLSGAAVSAKYPGLLFVALPLAAWLVGVHLREDWRRAWKPVGLFCLACGLGCGLWFAKNWLLTGNPTYPLMYGLFGGKTWTAEKTKAWNWVHLPHDFSLEALASDLGRVAIRSDFLSPLLIPLAALAFLVPSRRRLTLGLAGYFLLILAMWWLWALRVDRYWVPALPLVALLAGIGACWSGERIWRWTLVALLASGALFGFLVGASTFGGYNRYFVSLKRLRTDPERVNPWHAYFNAHAAGGRVLLVGEAQVFDFEVPVLYNTWLDDSIFERLVKGRTPAEVREAFRENAVAYVFVHWGEIQRYRDTGYARMEFVQPAVFDRLVAQGVLAPLPEIPDNSGRGYRVVPR